MTTISEKDSDFAVVCGVLLNNELTWGYLLRAELDLDYFLEFLGNKFAWFIWFTWGKVCDDNFLSELWVSLFDVVEVEPALSVNELEVRQAFCALQKVQALITVISADFTDLSVVIVELSRPANCADSTYTIGAFDTVTSTVYYSLVDGTIWWLTQSASWIEIVGGNASVAWCWIYATNTVHHAWLARSTTWVIELGRLTCCTYTVDSESIRYTLTCAFDWNLVLTANLCAKTQGWVENIVWQTRIAWNTVIAR